LLEQTKRITSINYNDNSNITTGDSEDVIRYKFSPDLGIDKNEIIGLLSNYFDFNRITIKESNNGLYIIVPDLGEKENIQVRGILNKIEKEALTNRLKRTR
jgi:hypothetical protein